MKTAEGTVRCYAGIGSRDTPEEVLDMMEELGTEYARAGWTLRSGAARGADSKFEQGCDAAGGAKEIYLPWEGFSPEGKYGSEDSRRYSSEPGVLVPPDLERAMRVSAEHWEGNGLRPWSTLSFGVRKLMGRNAYQVLGADLATPADLVLYWCPEPEKGGTVMALRIARAQGIECIRIANREVLETVLARLQGG